MVPPLDNAADDICWWTLPTDTLIWAEVKHDGIVHQCPFRLRAGTAIGGHPNMLRKAGAIQPLPNAEVPQAASGEKPQQAATPHPDLGINSNGGRG